MTNLHEEVAVSTGAKDFNFKVQFVEYGNRKYVEIVPLSKKYAGRVVKDMVLKLKDEAGWLDFLRACKDLQQWIKKENAWQEEINGWQE